MNEIISNKTIKIHSFISLFILYVFTISKSIRLPNDWAEGHWLIGYQFGFTKRGLPGEILRILVPSNYNMEGVIAILSITIFILVSICILFICWSIISHKSYGYDDFIILFVFISSGYNVMSAHLMGYYDHILFLLSLFSIYLINKNQIIFSSILLSISVFVHETTLFISIPIVLYSYLIRKDQFDFKNLFFNSFNICFFPFLTLIAVFLFNMQTNLDVKLMSEYLLNTGFIKNNYHNLVPEAFNHSFSNYLKNEFHNFLQYLSSIHDFIKIGIPCAYIFLIGWFKSKKDSSVFIFLLACILFPLSLHAIASDSVRIFSYSLIVCFMGYYILKTNNKLNESSQNKFFLEIIFSICFLLNFLIEIGLMDKQTERYNIYLKTISLVVFLIYFIFIRNLFVKKEAKQI